MAVGLSQYTPRNIASPERRSALNYRGTKVDDPYSSANIRVAREESNLADVGAVLQGIAAEGFKQQEKDRKERTKIEMAAAESYFISESLRVQSEIEQDPDYAGHEEKYTKDMEKVRSNAVGMVKDPLQHELLGHSLNTSLARGKATVKSNAYQKSVAAEYQIIQNTLKTNLQSLDMAQSDEERDALLITSRKLIEAGKDKGLYDDPVAFKLAQEFGDQYVVRRASNLPPELAMALLAPEDDGTFKIKEADGLQWINKIPAKTRMALYEKAKVDFRNDRLQDIAGVIDDSPAVALEGLNNGTLGQGLEPKDIKAAKTTARSALTNAETNARIDRISSAITDNDDAWTQYLDGEMTLSGLSELRANNRIDEDLARYMRDDLTKRAKKDVNEDDMADALIDLYDDLAKFDIHKERGELISEGNLEEYIRFQRKVMKHKKDGYITQGQMNTITKKLAAPFMDRVRSTREGRPYRIWPGDSSPYSKGYKAIKAQLKASGLENDNIAKKDMYIEFIDRLDAYRPEGAEDDYDIMEEKDRSVVKAAVKSVSNSVIDDHKTQSRAKALQLIEDKAPFDEAQFLKDKGYTRQDVKDTAKKYNMTEAQVIRQLRGN